MKILLTLLFVFVYTNIASEPDLACKSKTRCYILKEIGFTNEEMVDSTPTLTTQEIISIMLQMVMIVVIAIPIFVIICVFAIIYYHLCT